MINKKTIKKFLHDIQLNFFNIFITISYLLIIISAFGLSKKAPQLLINLDYYIRIYICLFLLWRFNPLREKYEFTDLDRKITFSAGLFILTTTVLNKYLIDAELKIKNFFN
jgi:hypothetical protein